MKLRSLHSRLITGVGIWTVVILVAIVLGGHVLAIHLPNRLWLVHDSMLTLSGVVIVAAGV